jgi:ribosomal protein S14
MLSLKFRNIKLQKNFNKVEKTKILGKFLENYICANVSRRKFFYRLKHIRILRINYFNKITRVRLKTRCIFTNRSNSVFRRYGSSRFVLRDLMQFGLLSGYKKAVW